MGSPWRSALLVGTDNTFVVREFGIAFARHGSSGFGGTWLGARLFQSSWLIGSVRLSLPTFVFRSSSLDVLGHPRFNKKLLLMSPPR